MAILVELDRTYAAVAGDASIANACRKYYQCDIAWLNGKSMVSQDGC